MNDITGLWHSTYFYFTSAEDAQQESEHDILFESQQGELVGRSQSEEEDSQVTLRLTQDEAVYTGTWQEKTDPKGRYGGQVFHGALQLIAVDHDTLEGQWVGFNGRRTTVKTGKWTLRRIQS